MAAPPDAIAQARTAAATAKITTATVRGPVSVLMGSGGNIAVLPGKDGKLLVDSGYSTSRPQVTEALSALGSEAPTVLINTHWHFDHTDGNEWMHSVGAEIVAHENTKRRMSTPQEIAAFHLHVPASPAGAIPTQTFAETKTLHNGTHTILLTHYAPAHTDTDISVYFPDVDVLHAGDTWFNGFYPFIDYSTGGNIDGMIAAAGKTLAMGTTSTRIIPGHGPVGDKTQLAAYRDMLADVREKVATLKRSGKTLPDAIAAKPTASLDTKWGHGLLDGDTFTALVYQGV